MSVIDFYGIASDSKGNILPNKKVCISDIDTSVVLQTTSTDAKGRFKFTVDDAGNYDIYRGTTIKTPVIQKANNVNFLGTVSISFGSVVNDPNFAVNHFDSNVGDCILAGYHKEIYNFGIMRLYCDDSEYVPTGDLACNQYFWFDPDLYLSTDDEANKLNLYFSTTKIFNFAFVNQHDPLYSLTPMKYYDGGNTPWFFGMYSTYSSTMPMYLGMTAGVALMKRSTHPWTAFTNVYNVDGDIHYLYVDKFSTEASPTNVIRFFRLIGLDDYSGGLCPEQFYLELLNTSGTTYQATVYNNDPAIGAIIAQGTITDADGNNIRITLAEQGGSGVSGYIIFDYNADEDYLYNYDYTADDDYYFWDGYEWRKILATYTKDYSDNSLIFYNGLKIYPDYENYATKYLFFDVDTNYLEIKANDAIVIAPNITNKGLEIDTLTEYDEHFIRIRRLGDTDYASLLFDLEDYDGYYEFRYNNTELINISETTMETSIDITMKTGTSIIWE